MEKERKGNKKALNLCLNFLKKMEIMTLRLFRHQEKTYQKRNGHAQSKVTNENNS